jgi:hypothetical protein
MGGGPNIARPELPGGSPFPAPMTRNDEFGDKLIIPHHCSSFLVISRP